MGIAPVCADLWAQYAVTSASAWDPGTAIGALGYALCDLAEQLAVIGGDAFDLALAGLRAGATAVRQAGGIPAVTTVKQFVSQVDSDAAHYAKLAALGGVSPSPTTQPTSSPQAPPADMAGRVEVHPSCSQRSYPPSTCGHEKLYHPPWLIWLCPACEHAA